MNDLTLKPSPASLPGRPAASVRQLFSLSIFSIHLQTAPAKQINIVQVSPECRASRLQGVYPALEATRRAREDAGVAHGVGKQRAALVRGEQVDGEIARVAAAQRPELPLRPLDRDAHQLSGRETGLPNALVEFRAETAERTAVLGN